MKWDDGVQDRRLSLDITPLIDVVFLLVLFFAVSTSFISAGDLSALRQDVASLARDKESLSADVAERTEEVAGLQRRLLEQLQDSRDLNAMVAALEQRRASLRASLDEVEHEKRSLREQLEQAARDYAALDLELEGLGAERDRAAEQERLLRALLLEKEAATADLQRALAEAAQRREQDRSARARIETERDAAAASLAEMTLVLEETRDARVQLEQRERLLQALLAERAAEYEGLEVRLVRAEERNQGLVESLATLETESEDQGRAALEQRTEILRLQAELARYRAVAELDREQIEQVLQAQRSLQEGLESYLRDNRLSISRERQRLVVQLSDQILFPSGSAEINAQGMAVLGTFGDIIKSRIGNLQIQIAGHTDDVPIASGAGVLATNWGLSAARAVNVVRFLEKEVGIDPRRLSAVGYGEQRPVASNATERGRAANRRIEIVLVPR